MTLPPFTRYWGVGDGRPGSLVTYFERSPAREGSARMGAGQVAHYAVGAQSGAIEPLQGALAVAGLPVSPVGDFGPDGARFQAVGTRDPDGQHVIVASEHAS